MPSGMMKQYPHFNVIGVFIIRKITFTITVPHLFSPISDFYLLLFYSYFVPKKQFPIPSPVPEPFTLFLFGSGLVVFVVIKSRRFLL
jgi:hypothetical protein